MNLSRKLFLYVVLMFCISWQATAQRDNIRFEHISIDQGLSQSTVYCILQDSTGFIWFGTEDGLNKYNGYEFKIYYNDTKKANSISSNRIYTLLKDSEGVIWIGTLGGGLCRYNVVSDNFTTYKNDKNDPSSLSSDVVMSICEDSKKNLWIGTAEGGLCKFDKKTGKFKTFKNIPGDINSITANVIRSIDEDAMGNIWLATDGGGVCILNPTTEKFTKLQNLLGKSFILNDDQVYSVFIDSHQLVWIGTARSGLFVVNLKENIMRHYSYSAENSNSLANNQIMKIFEDSKGDLWIGTYGGLSWLKKENIKDGFFINKTYSSSNPYGISNNMIRSIYEDNRGLLWIGTYQDGINKFNRSHLKFAHYHVSQEGKNSLKNNTVKGIIQDNNGKFWIATYGGGIDIFNIETETFENLSHINGNANSLEDNVVSSLRMDKEGIIWIGSYGGGLSRYDPNKKQFKHFKNEKNNPNSLSNNFIRALLLDKEGLLWIGTSGGGLNCYDEKNNTFTIYKNKKDDQNSLSEDRVLAICEDSQGYIWLGTSNQGLNKFDKTTKKFKTYKHDENDSSTLSNNRIFCITETSDNALWVGTGRGLNRLDKTSGKFLTYSKLDGLPNDVIFGILEDKNQNIWLSTNYGISKAKWQKDGLTNFQNYDVKDGLQSNAFNEGSFFKSTKGLLFFGGVNGFNYFSPENVTENKFVPNVQISDFKIFNKNVDIGESSPLKTNIALTKEIKLTYRDYIFSFEFAALDYTNPEKIKYMFMLENFDKTWNITDSKHRFVTYTNIEPGEYTFKVKATNADGIWNEKATEIKISIEPPFWKTLLFKILVALSAFISLVFYIQVRERNLKTAKRVLEEKVIQRTSEIEKQKQEIVAQAKTLELTNKELEKLSIVASETDNAVIIMDKDGNFEWVNEGFERLYNQTLEVLIKNFGSNIIDTSHNPNIQELFNKCIREKKSVVYEAAITNNDQRKVWVQTTLTPIYDEQGQLKKLITIDSDITPAKEAEIEISLQKDILQTQNEHIKSSINYALTIQHAFLPNPNLLDEYFESFIIYKPKDIVSGDFYWFTQLISPSDENLLVIAVVDCTGHGVPGAFMSLIGNRLLNEIISEKKIADPAAILNLLNEGIVKALKQNETQNSDGMDASICLVKKNQANKIEITYAGAKQCIIHFREQENQLDLIKGDRKTIGGNSRTRNAEVFKNNLITVSTNDMIYLYTDGIIDQNQTNRSRFGTMRFIQMINQTHSASVMEQKIFIESKLNEFQKNEVQRDDITVIGLKVKG